MPAGPDEPRSRRASRHAGQGGGAADQGQQQRQSNEGGELASLVIGKPQQRKDHDHIAGNCWEAEEARAFLAAAKAAGPQPAALFAFAIDTGARKNELCGLQWGDLDLEAGTVTIVRQLVKTGRKPEFGPIKNNVPRTIDLGAETVTLLKEHKRTQAALKMRNRVAYHDLGMVFAKEWGDLHGREDSLGLPLQSNNLGQREFARIIKAAKVKPITIHGLRHTSATLLLKASRMRQGGLACFFTVECAPMLPSRRSNQT